MSSSDTLPSPENDYAAPTDSSLNKAFWDAALTSIGARIRALEAVKADWEELIAQGTGQALAVIQANVEPQLVALTDVIDQLKTDVAEAEDAIAIITAGGIGMENVAGLSAALSLKANITYVDAAIDALKGDAPEAYDTLVEIATKLSEDDTAIAGLLTEIAGKVPQTRKLIAGTGLKFNTAGEAALSGDITATLEFAPTAEAITGTAVDKPMNAENVYDAIAAQAPKQGASAALSGTAVDLGVSSLNRFAVRISGASFSGTSNVRLRLKSGGAVVTTGYLSNISVLAANAVIGPTTDATDGFGVYGTGTAAHTYFGEFDFTHLGGNHWQVIGQFSSFNTARIMFLSGEVTLPGVLDGIRLTSVGGTDTFDGGNAYILEG